MFLDLLAFNIFTGSIWVGCRPGMFFRIWINVHCTDRGIPNGVQCRIGITERALKNWKTNHGGINNLIVYMSKNSTTRMCKYYELKGQFVVSEKNFNIYYINEEIIQIPKYKLHSTCLNSSIQNATWHHSCMNWLHTNLTFTMRFCQPLGSIRDTAHKEECLPKQEEAFTLWLPPGNGGTTGNPTDGHAVEPESALLLCPSLLQTFDRKSGTEIRAATSNCSWAASGSHVANA